jgi:hypothetical protein
VRLDFGALRRIHPSAARRPSRGRAAGDALVVFDVLAIAGEDLRATDDRCSYVSDITPMS